MAPRGKQLMEQVNKLRLMSQELIATDPKTARKLDELARMLSVSIGYYGRDRFEAGTSWGYRQNGYMPLERDADFQEWIAAG